MIEKNRKLSPRRIDNRENALAFINAAISMGILVCGLVIINLIAGAPATIESEQDKMDYLVIEAVCAIMLSIAFFANALMEVNAVLIRREKRAIFESVPFAAGYLLIAVLFFALPVDLTLGAFIFTIIYVVLNFTKLLFTHLKRAKKKTVGWYISTVILGLFGIAFIVHLILVRNDHIDFWSFVALYMVLESTFLIFYAIFRKMNATRLFNILYKTHAFEILLGFFFMIAAVSITLTFIEPKMSSPLDAIWYCFAVFTTIGFGDLVAVTPVGKILTVFLGIYGIVITALLTSIIVNLYNETKAAEEASKAAYLAEKAKEEAAEQEEEARIAKILEAIKLLEEKEKREAAEAAEKKSAAEIVAALQAPETKEEPAGDDEPK